MKESDGGHVFTLSIDRDWRITSISPSAASWGGSTPHELVGADSRERWPLPTPLVRAIEDSLASGQPAEVEFASVLIPGRWVKFHVIPSEDGADISFADVTESVVSRQRVAGPRAADPYNVAGDAVEIALLDASGVILSVNAAWRASAAALSPRIGSAGIGMRYVDLCARVLPQLNVTDLAADLERLLTGSTPMFGAVYEIGAPPHKQTRQVQIAPLHIGKAAYFVAIHENLTPRQTVAKALRDTSQQLLSAQEDERERIAQELHDSMSQNLAAMSMGLFRLGKLTEGLAETGELIGELSNLLQEALSEMRALSFVMTASRLQHLGLTESARHFVEGFGRRSGLSTQFTVEGSVDDTNDAIQHAIFRVVQEAITNAYRHSGATSVRVEIKGEAGQLTARIHDNGGGMRFSGGVSETAPLGVGISGMRARMQQLGGILEITSDGGGTTVLACVPKGAGPGPATSESRRPSERRKPSGRNDAHLRDPHRDAPSHV